MRSEEGRKRGPASTRAAPFLRSGFRIRPWGFTFIELLLVVAISLIAAGIAVPLFARSYQGSQLRSATRYVAMTAKYSRSMAVLRQQYMAILFDKVAGSIEVVSIADRRALAARSRFLAERAAPAADADATPAIRSEFRRQLPADVKIVSFRTHAGDRALEDIYWVNYFPNGMSEGFEIELQDKSGKRARVRVDGLNGNASVAFDR